MTCAICGKELPNRWAVGRRETVDGVERCYCQLHANENFGKKPKAKGEQMEEKQEQEIAKSASRDLARKAWTECSALAGKLGGGVKTLWTKIHPDHSPEAMLAALNGDLAGNKTRLDQMKPELDQVYREIVAKKKEYQTAAPVRQRLLKIELQTLMARYKGLEREFSILCENERSIETVKGRFLEVLAHGLRGKLDTDMVDRLADTVDDRAEEAEDIQDALGDLERAGKRRDRGTDDFDAELAGFDGELGLSEADDVNVNTNEKETTNENTAENPDAVADGSVIA